MTEEEEPVEESETSESEEIDLFEGYYDGSGSDGGSGDDADGVTATYHVHVNSLYSCPFCGGDVRQMGESLFCIPDCGGWRPPRGQWVQESVDGYLTSLATRGLTSE